jgi:nitrogenase subunit NifH/nitrogenase molybdenum-iron protein alpha/beta subunit
VLDYLKEKSPDQCKLEDIVHQGSFGVHCVESGGPEPGVGCAGRGILTSFELLERLGVRDYKYDAVIYDVLGDVVCGGFAVPIRREYAEKVYIVSSGEFMSLYAANNILRGLKNYDRDAGRAGGIILNSRGLGDEDARVRRFCDAVKLPLIARFPRSELFSDCEKEGLCLMEKFPDSELAQQFTDLANLVYSSPELYPASPLSDEELEERILDKKPAANSAPKAVIADLAKTAPKKQFFSKSLVSREPLHGCAFSGAMSISTQVADSVSIAHGPRSCAHITFQSLTSFSRRILLERGIVLPYISAPPVVSSGMNERVMIYGGIEELRQKVIEIKAGQSSVQQAPNIIFVLTTCPSGIIGDDMGFLKDLEDIHTRIIPILTDGNLQGDYLQGIIIAYMEIAKALINRNVTPLDNTINIVAEKPETNARAGSFEFIKEVTEGLGITINSHFICETSTEEIRNFKKGKLNILAYGDYMGRTIRDFLISEYNAEFFDLPFPVGFTGSEVFVRRLGEYFHKDNQIIEKMLKKQRNKYHEELTQIKPFLKNKRVMVINFNQSIDWILHTLIDLEMEIAFVGILSYSQDNSFKTDFESEIGELHPDYNNQNRQNDLKRIKPDLLLANYGSNEQDEGVIMDTIPYCPTAGFTSGLIFARRWADLFRMNLNEGWRKDEQLFRKYNS